MSFLKSESGAVTVDWVVLTAGLVGLGLATMTVVASGVQDLSTDIDQELSSDDIIKTSFPVNYLDTIVSAQADYVGEVWPRCSIDQDGCFAYTSYNATVIGEGGAEYNVEFRVPIHDDLGNETEMVFTDDQYKSVDPTQIDFGSVDCIDFPVEGGKKGETTQQCVSTYS